MSGGEASAVTTSNGTVVGMPISHAVVDGAVHLTLDLSLDASTIVELIVAYNGSDPADVAETLAGPGGVDAVLADAAAALLSRLDEAHDASQSADGLDDVVAALEARLGA